MAVRFCGWSKGIGGNWKLAFGTVDCWLLWNLTQGQVHATDVSNASRTMLYNINDMEWDKELLTLFEIPQIMLPKVKPSSHNYGLVDKNHFGHPIPIAYCWRSAISFIWSNVHRLRHGKKHIRDRLFSYYEYRTKNH